MICRVYPGIYKMPTQVLSASLMWPVVALAGTFLAFAVCAYRAKSAIRQLHLKINNLNVEIKRISHNLNAMLQLQPEAAHLEEDIDEKKLYIGNIDYSASEAELAAHFGRFGQIETCNIPVDRYTGKARGFGFITFKKVADAMKAMDLDGSEFKGRQIQVNFARERATSMA